ncbi:unnamed protein product [Parnassius apollo]|uniref:(apollo) hypothetical protein n=1 Tax=Parnassius apollo TaxID=110799 RepID=A0A8S3YEX3_PARAO|nr:unnamed protein product [Parnassius apollo]
MDFDSDDSTYDLNYNPCDDGSEKESSESDSASETWNLLTPQRRQSTFSDDLLHSLPNIQRRRTLRTQLAETLSSEANIASSSGTTSLEITEMTWLKRKLENTKWEMPSHEDPESIEYTVPFSGMKDIFSGILAHAKPLDYFEPFLTRNILEEVVDQTNLYAAQHLLTTDATPNSRTHAWVPVTVDNMTKFLALIGWMGLVKLPSIKDYWRVHRLYGLPLARSVMPRNKFELILKYIHFSDNSIEDADDRLKKKVCLMKIGQLAYRLRRRKTHLVGTQRANRKHLPKDVMSMKLKRGEMCAKQTNDGIVALKWRDKRDVRMLSTNTSAFKIVTVQNRNKPAILKPECIVDYNNGKSSIDISDHMATYGSALRRCTKWYRKLFIEILWGTSLVKAHFLYNLNTSAKKITITEFREQVILDMIDKCSQRVGIAPVPSTSSSKRKAPNVKHYLIEN